MKRENNSSTSSVNECIEEAKVLSEPVQTVSIADETRKLDEPRDGRGDLRRKYEYQLWDFLIAQTPSSQALADAFQYEIYDCILVF